MTFVYHETCTTCKKAKKWLEEHGCSFEMRDIKASRPNETELREWHRKSRLALRKFFNTSGLLYRALELKDQLPNMSEEEQFRLLASDGMLVKRPILITESSVLVGFKPEVWAAALNV